MLSIYLYHTSQNSNVFEIFLNIIIIIGNRCAIERHETHYWVSEFGVESVELLTVLLYSTVIMIDKLLLSNSLSSRIPISDTQLLYAFIAASNKILKLF